MKALFSGFGLVAALSCWPSIAVILFGLGGVFASVLATMGEAPLLSGLVGATALTAAAGGLVRAASRSSSPRPGSEG